MCLQVFPNSSANLLINAKENSAFPYTSTHFRRSLTMYIFNILISTLLLLLPTYWVVEDRRVSKLYIISLWTCWSINYCVSD